MRRYKQTMQTCLSGWDYAFINYVQRDEFHRLHPRRRVEFDVWDMVDGEPSRVGLRGESVHRPQVRDSVTIKDLFTCHMPERFAMFFSKVCTGIGSKHIYGPQGFMKEHLDTPLPDHQGLPHWGTMVVTRQANGLRVCGQAPPLLSAKDTDDAVYSNSVITLFSLACPHEVVPPVLHERHSFVFPVFGIYRGLQLAAVNSKVTTVYDAVRELVEPMDPFNPKLAEVHGHVKALDDNECNDLMFRLRHANGEYLFEDGASTFNRESPPPPLCMVRYVDPHGQKVETQCSETMRIPNGSADVVVSFDAGQSEFKALLLQRIAQLQDAALHVGVTEHKADPIVKAWCPPPPFPVRLKGRYVPAAQVSDLFPEDRAVFDYLVQQGWTVQFAPTAELPNALCTYAYDRSTNAFVPARASEDLLNITELIAEYDDQGSYDPQFVRVYALLSVNQSEC